MQARHQISKPALELIEAFEGFQAKAQRLETGGWTIGYGHTLSAREGAEVSRADAEALLIYDLQSVARAVAEWVFAPLEPNQFDGLCAFAYAVGLETFRHSEVLKRVNAGDMLGAAAEMELWRKARVDGGEVVVDALVRRRAAEKALFLKPQAGWTPAPSAVLRPRRDGDSVPLMLDDPVAEAAAETATRPAPRSLETLAAAFPSAEMRAPGVQAPEDLNWVSRIAKLEAETAKEPQEDSDRPRMGVVSLSAIGLLGLALLGVGLYRTPNAGFGAGPLIGWAIGLSGLALFCAAAYLLLEWLSRVGQKEEE